MSATLELPDDILATAREHAAKHGLSVEDFVALAIADRTGADEETERFFREREKRAMPGAWEAALAAVPNRPADPWDAKP